MLTVSQAYKRDIRKNLRNRSYMVVDVGVINQDAQSNAYVDTAENETLWFSDNNAVFTSYNFEAYYATAEQDFTSVDGTMFFAPEDGNAVALTQGSVSDNVLGSITINFGGLAYDLRGLTIDFGKNYPVSFEIYNNGVLADTITGNDQINFVYDGVIFGCRYLTIKPLVMSGGNDRLRILKFTAGIGVTFDNTTIIDSKRSQYVSPLSEDLPSIDFSLTVDNSNRFYDIENDRSTINYFETGQDVKIRYGYTLDNGTVEWLNGGNLILTGWKADDSKMSLTAVDRWTLLDTEFYKGRFYPNGITLYQLAEDVFADAGLDTGDYDIDTYLQGITVYNPLPVCTHAEAIQYIANAGRCIMTQDVDGILIIKHSFAAQRLPDMTVSATGEHEYSTVSNVLSSEPKYHYAISNEDLVTSDGDFVIRPGETAEKLYTGFFSAETSDSSGYFTENPTITVDLEASYVSYGLTITYAGNHPLHQIVRTYLNGSLVETHTYDVGTNEWSTTDQFAEFDRMVIEIDRAAANNNVFLDYIGFGEVSDYTLTYSQELSAYPTGEKIAKIKSIDQVIYNYTALYETPKELYKEALDVTGLTTMTMTLSNPSYNLSATIGGTNATVLDSGAYFLTIQVPSGKTGLQDVEITGNEYVVNEQDYYFAINDTGKTISYANPLVSTETLASDLVEWEGDYNYSDRMYPDLDYRGDPRIEANDLVLLENKYVSQCFLRIIDSEINFGGGLSGKISARRDLSASGSFAGRVARLKANTTTADHAATADKAEVTANIETPNAGGYTTDQYGNFVHASTTTTNSWNIKANDGTNKFQVNFETGETNVNGNLIVSGTEFATLKFSTSKYNGAYIRAYDDSEYGQKVLFQSGGSMVIGSGEFAYNLYNGKLDGTDDASGEQLFIGSDSHFNLYSNGNTIANRHRWQFATDGALYLPDTAYPTGTNQPKLTKDGNLYMKTANVEGWLSTILTGKVDSSLAGSGFASLADFVTATAAAKAQYGWAFNFKDTTGWGPLGTANTWYRCVVQYQNNLGTSSSVAGTIRVYGAALLQQWTGYITGTTADAATVVWRRYIISNSAEQLAAGRAIISGTYGEIGVSSVTSTELGYLDGVTSNIQTQIDNVTPDRTANSSTGLASTSIAQNTNTNGGSFTLSKGRYIVTVTARWNANATGSRQVWLATTSTGGAMTYNDVSSIQAANGAVTSQQFTSLIKVTASTTYYIVLYHTSTAAVTCTTRYSIMKLSNI